jgi:hypothetical protein
LATDYPDFGVGNPGNGWEFTVADRGNKIWRQASLYSEGWTDEGPALLLQWSVPAQYERYFNKNIGTMTAHTYGMGVMDPCSDTWTGEGLGLPPNKVAMKGDWPYQDAVAKWTAPTAGTYAIDAYFTFISYRTYTPDQLVTVHVRKNSSFSGGSLNTTTLFTDPNLGDGNSVHYGHLNATYHGAVTLAANDTIEFWVVGSQFYIGEIGTTNQDAVQVDATISPAAFLVVETGGSTAVKEGSTTDTYQIQRLAGNPTANVDVTLTPDPGIKINGNAAGAPVVVTFTPGGATSLTVTVEAVHDGIPQITHVATIAQSATSADPVYNGKTAPTVYITVTDSCTTYLTGDIDHDCFVNFEDFTNLADSWLQSSI